MRTRASSHRRLILLTLGLAYVALGMLGALPAASLIQLARNTHVSLEVAGFQFTVSSVGGMLGIIGCGILIRAITPKYLLLLGLCLLGSGSLATVLTREFSVLLLGQLAVGVAFGFIDISLNTIATLAFQEPLASNLTTIHGLFSLGALLGPVILAVGLHVFTSLELAYVVGVGIAAISMPLVLVQPLPELARPARDGQRSRTERSELRTVLSQRLLWLLVWQLSITSAAQIGFRSWIVTAVSQRARISLAQAAPVASAFFLGMTAGQFGGVVVLRRGWLSERIVLYMALVGAAVWGAIAARVPGQVPIAYAASVLVGCCYGPLYPGLMALASRRFVQAIDVVSSLMIISTDASTVIVPAAMGLLIPSLGITWVMTIPALCCAVVLLPMMLANRLLRQEQPDLRGR
jgi:fucose permease